MSKITRTEVNDYLRTCTTIYFNYKKPREQLKYLCIKGETYEDIILKLMKFDESNSKGMKR